MCWKSELDNILFIVHSSHRNHIESCLLVELARCWNLDWNSQQSWVPVTLPLRWRQMEAPYDDEFHPIIFLTGTTYFSESQLKQRYYQTFLSWLKPEAQGAREFNHFTCRVRTHIIPLLIGWHQTSLWLAQSLGKFGASTNVESGCIFPQRHGVSQSS